MCRLPKQNRKPIYRIVRDPLGILIPTYSKEQFERVQRNSIRLAAVFAVLMLAAACFSGFFLFSIIKSL